MDIKAGIFNCCGKHLLEAKLRNVKLMQPDNCGDFVVKRILYSCGFWCFANIQID